MASEFSEEILEIICEEISPSLLAFYRRRKPYHLLPTIT